MHSFQDLSKSFEAQIILGEPSKSIPFHSRGPEGSKCAARKGSAKLKIEKNVFRG